MKGNHLQAPTASWLQHPLSLSFFLSFHSSLSPSLSLLLCFLPSFCFDSLPRCMSSHLNYCRHCCRITTTPTGLTGKVNKLLKLKNSAGESGVISSLHLLFLPIFLAPPPVLAFFFFFHFTVCLGAMLFFPAVCILWICVDFFIGLLVFFFIFYVFFSIQISVHTLFYPHLHFFLGSTLPSLSFTCFSFSFVPIDI